MHFAYTRMKGGCCAASGNQTGRFATRASSRTYYYRVDDTLENQCIILYCGLRTDEEDGLVERLAETLQDCRYLLTDTLDARSRASL